MYKILFIMRVIAFLFFAAIMQVSASTSAQKLTYVQKNASLEQLFKEIKKQTGYNIVWYEGKLNPEWLVNANFRKTPLKDVMDIALTGMQLDYTISNKTVVIKEKEMSLMDKLKAAFGNIVVHGRVVDETGAGLQGASVKVKNTNKVTITDVDGHFTLNGVPEKSTLVISYLGFETKEVEASEKMENLQLISGAGKLEEVQINAGYYTVTDRERTGSISRITSEVIEKQPVSNLLMALQNRVPGLEITQLTGVPGGGINVRIRGQNSIKSGNDPLYIIDGVIYPSTRVSSSNSVGILAAGASPLSMINPYDIESIEILKDADATAIYGSRGANGVVLIKTKRGEIGNTKINTGITKGYNKVDRRLDLLSTDQYLEMRKEALKNDGLDPAPTDYDLVTWRADRNVDWQKELIGRTAKTTMATLNLTGGSDKISYLVSGNYYKEGTVFPGDFDFNRAALHSSLNFGSSTDRLNGSFTTNYSNTRSNLLLNDLSIFILLPPNQPAPYDEFGKLNWDNNTVYMNPFATLLQTNKAEADNLVSQLTLNYRILENLVFKASLGYNTIKRQEFQKNPLNSFAPGLNYTASNRSSIFADIYNNNWVAEPQINYNSRSGSGKIDALIGMSFQENKTQTRTVKASGFSSDILMDNIASASLITPFESIYAQYRYTGIFARLNYSLFNRYYINFTARRDGSSRFGNGKQFANFGAIGTSWIFSDENFIKESLPFLSTGKIRASYGVTGNDQIPDYGYLQVWTSSSGNYQGLPTLQPLAGRVANPDFSWETNKKAEVSMKLGFINDKINLEISYYNNHSSNQLVGDPLPLSSGGGSITANRPAKIQNTGLEFETTLKIIEKKDWQWLSGFNLTIPKNKLMSYPSLSTSTDALNYIIGKPLSIRKIYHVTGVNSQTGLYDIEDKDGNGVLNSNDRYLYKFIGQYLYGSIHNSLTFKKITIDFLLSFNKQNGINYMQNSDNGGNWFEGGPNYSNQPTVVLNRWQKINDQTSIQKFSTLGNASTQFSNAVNFGGLSIVDASYIRLKNISISYNLPKNWVSAMKLSNMMINLQGQNIFTISNFIGLDPESQNIFRLPPLKSLTIGINITI